MRKLKSIQQVIEDGFDPETTVVDPDDLGELDDDTIDNLAQGTDDETEDSEDD